MMKMAKSSVSQSLAQLISLVRIQSAGKRLYLLNSHMSLQLGCQMLKLLRRLEDLALQRSLDQKPEMFNWNELTLGRNFSA